MKIKKMNLEGKLTYWTLVNGGAETVTVEKGYGRTYICTFRGKRHFTDGRNARHVAVRLLTEYAESVNNK